jgi:hypothetical protein
MALAGLALAALLPRALAATLRAPWHDEYFTVWAATLPLKELIAALRLDSGPPLPYLLVKLISMVGIPTLFAARALAVAAGTAAVLLAARASRRVFGAETGWWTGALLAFHPLAVAWSCEGRAYALLLLAVAWAWDRLEALAAGRRAAIGFAFAVARCWCHGLGLLAVVSRVGRCSTAAEVAGVGAVAAGRFLPPLGSRRGPPAARRSRVDRDVLAHAPRGGEARGSGAPSRPSGVRGFLDLPSRCPGPRSPRRSWRSACCRRVAFVGCGPAPAPRSPCCPHALSRAWRRSGCGILPRRARLSTLAPSWSSSGPAQHARPRAATGTPSLPTRRRRARWRSSVGPGDPRAPSSVLRRPEAAFRSEVRS